MVLRGWLVSSVTLQCPSQKERGRRAGSSIMARRPVDSAIELQFDPDVKDVSEPEGGGH